MSDAAHRLRQALQMHDEGMAMYRLRLRRDYPEWSAAAVDDAVRSWQVSAPLEPGRAPSEERWRRLTGHCPPNRS